MTRSSLRGVAVAIIFMGLYGIASALRLPGCFSWPLLAAAFSVLVLLGDEDNGLTSRYVGAIACTQAFLSFIFGIKYGFFAAIGSGLVKGLFAGAAAFGILTLYDRIVAYQEK